MSEGSEASSAFSTAATPPRTCRSGPSISTRSAFDMSRSPLDRQRGVDQLLQLLGEALDHALDRESLANVARRYRSHAQAVRCRSQAPQVLRERLHIAGL